MSGIALLATIINAVALGVVLAGLAMLMTQADARNWRSHSGALMALLGILALDVASSIIAASPLARACAGLSGLIYFLWPWMPVLLLAYVERLTRIDGVRPAHAKWHVGIAVLAMVCLIPFAMLPGSVRLELEAGLVSPEQVASAFPALLGLLVVLLIWLSHMLLAALLIAARLIAYRRRMRDLLSDVRAADLKWLDGLGLFIILAVGVMLADYGFAIFGDGEVLSELGGALFELVVIGGLVAFGVTQQRAVPAWAEMLDQEMEDSEAPCPPDIQPGPPDQRYARSALTQEDCAAIIARLETAMARDRLWRDPMLNLKALAGHLGTRPQYLTQALNTELETSFYDYVNSWRVRDASLALIGSEASVLSICLDAGFNSKSTFNKVFARETGYTPTAYRRSKAVSAAT